MTINYINTGSSANAGNGDTLRLAFTKINANFSDLVDQISTIELGTTSTLVAGTYTFALSNTGTVTLNGEPFVSGGGVGGATGATGPTGAGFSNLTSTSTNTISTGTFTFIVNQIQGVESAFMGGQYILAYAGVTGDVMGGIYGQILYYYDQTLILNGYEVLFGSGTTSSWYFELTGAKGINGTIGLDGATGPAGPTNTATTATLGGIIVGHNLAITSEGTLSAITSITSDVAPADPVEGDQWWDSNLGRGFVYYSGIWVEMSPQVGGGGGAAVDFTNVDSNILPAANLTYDLGSTSSQWRSLYVGTGTIYIGGVALGVSQDNYVTVNGNNIVTVNTAGNLTIQGNTDVVLGSVAIDSEAPLATTPGSLWYNSVEGRTYIAYNGIWVDTNPTEIPSPETYLDGLAIDGTTISKVNIDSVPIVIETSTTATTSTWTFGTDGVTGLPSGLTIAPLSNFVPVPGTAIQQNENEILQIVSKGLSGGMTVGWTENPFEPSRVAALTFNAAAEQVHIATGSYTGTVNTWVFDQNGVLTTPQGGALGSEGMGWPGFSNGVSGLPLSIVNKNPDGLYLSNITLYASGSGNAGVIELTVWNTETVVSKTITINTAGNIVLPGGGVIDGSDYDVEITASNDGSSTFGSVTINTQGLPEVYTVVQQWSPFNLDTISTDLPSTPNIASIVPGMTVTGAGITAVTTVTGVTGPDEFGAFFISVSPASETGLTYNETYTFTSAGGITNRNWQFNSLGELNLPRGGAIQETNVTNELWGTTTTSLTLVPAGAANGTQRLEIYSTGAGEGDHIHITSGDQNQTALFLGNDTQYFAVSAGGANYIQARTGAASPSPGTPANAGSPVWIYAGDAGDNGGNVADGASGGDVYIASGISSSGLGGNILLQTSSGPTGYGNIKLSTDGGSSYLEFDKDDQLTFPSGGGIIFDSSATSTITGVSHVVFFDGTTQTTAWLGGGSRSMSTTAISSNNFNIGNFSNNATLDIDYTAFTGDYGIDFDIAYQAPLDGTKGVTVGAIETPLIISTGTVILKTDINSSTSTWTFGTDGTTTFPDSTVQTTAWTGIAATATTSSTAASVGYIGMPQNSTSTNYGLVIGDMGKHVYVTSTSTVTVPSYASVDFSIGTTIAVIAGSSATVSIAITTDTMYLAGTGTTGTRTLAAFGMATLVKVAQSTWFISGVGLT